MLRQVVAAQQLSPGWLSLRLLSWLSAAAASGATLLMWLNQQGLRTALTEEAARRLGAGVWVMGLCAVALLAIAVVHYSFGRRGSAVGASLYVLAVLASVTLPVVARGEAAPRTLGTRSASVGSWVVPSDGRSRVVMLLFDGASLDYLSLATAAGRLPNFGRILDAGAAMHLATLRPTQPGPVWATVATGKYPPRHGVISASTYRVAAGLPPIKLLPDHCFAQALVYFGLFDEVPASSAELRARPVWRVLSGQGIQVGIVGLPLTYPVQPINGFLVSDRFHLVVDPRIDPVLAEAAYPPAAVAVGTAAMREVSGADVLDTTGAANEGALVPPSQVAPIWRDRVYGRIVDELWTRFRDVRLLAVRYRGLDLAGHRFLPLATPVPFIDSDDPNGKAVSLDEYYHHVDDEVGSILNVLTPGDLLLVVSGFGMEPVSVIKRALARIMGDPNATGTHENAPDGFLLAYGTDVAPTVLYYLGIPVARDIDGVARTDLFQERFTERRPIVFVSSYDK